MNISSDGWMVRQDILPVKKKFCGADYLKTRQNLISLVPEVGIEPTLPRGKGDFESPASTSFTTPARAAD